MDNLAWAASVQDEYRYQLKHFVKWAHITGHDFDEEGIREYFKALNEMGFMVAGIKNKRSAVKKRWRQLHKDESYEVREHADSVLRFIAEDYPAPKFGPKVSGTERIITEADYKSLLAHCRSDRQRLYMRFYWETGCRNSELCMVRLAHCKKTIGTVSIRLLGKGKKEREVFISENLYDAIRDVFKGKEYLFETSTGHMVWRGYISDQIRVIGQLIGRELSASSFRHSYATRKVRQFPGRLDAVARQLGHTDASFTVNTYCHNTMTPREASN